MTISHYPHGFSHGVSIRGLPILNTYGGNIFWVNSAIGSDSYKGTRERPFATLDYAIGRCAANNGDIIILAPNHNEALTGVAAVAFDVAGITIMGLGLGRQRPLISLESATTTFAVTAADTIIIGVEFQAGAADVVTCFDTDAAGFHLVGCRFSDAAVNENFLAVITSGSATDNVCDGMVVEDNYWYSPDAACTHLIAHTGDVDVLRVNRNTVLLPASTAGELVDVAAGDDMQGVEITWNLLQHAMTAGELFVSNNQSDNSGIIAHNRIGHADVTTTHDLGIDALGCRLFDNLSTSTGSASGFVLPAIDTDA
jgi:hypothetical protein